MTRTAPLRPAGIGPIDRFAGVAPQFDWTGKDYHYRRDGWGAPIPVTVAERDTFVRAARHSLLLHLVAMALGILAAVLLAARFDPEGAAWIRAGIGAIIVSAIGLALYRSHVWSTRAPARALVNRRPVGPPGDVDVARWPGYGTILLGVFAVIVTASTQTAATPSSAVVFSIVAIVAGVTVAVMKWRFERVLTPAQRERAAQWREAERMRHRSPPRGFVKNLLLLLFLIVEVVLVLLIFIGVMTASIDIAGSSWEDPAAAPFLIGFLLSGVGIALALWPLEILCKRLTGTGALDAFNGFPF